MNLNTTDQSHFSVGSKQPIIIQLIIQTNTFMFEMECVFLGEIS